MTPRIIFVRSSFARVLAVVLFLQGAGPAFMWGVWRPGGWLPACLAVVYTLLAGSVWRRKLWALPIAFAITLPQLVAWSSSWCSWRMLILGGYGFGVEPADTFWTSYAFGYRSYGCCINCAFGYSQPLLADFRFVRQPTFLLVNMWVAALLALLLIVLVTDLLFAFFPPASNHTLPRAETGGETGSGFGA